MAQLHVIGDGLDGGELKLAALVVPGELLLQREDRDDQILELPVEAVRLRHV